MRITDILLSRYLRRLYRREMRLSISSVSQPQPEAGKTYLLYIHVPFCESLCPFCPFHRVLLDHDQAQRYFEALRREIHYWHENGFKFNDVYVGGGTPTVLPTELARLLDLIQQLFQVSTISVETNPNHLREPVLRPLQEAGVRRLSVGVQSLDDQLLKEIGRYEQYGSSNQILECLQATQSLFDTFNVDMIFNFPHQTSDSLRRDLRLLKNLQIDQISYYPLMPTLTTVGGMFSQTRVMTFDRERAMYEIIRDTLTPEYKPGSAWCFARRPAAIDEYLVDHDEYLGIGSGSFSYVNGAFYASTFSIDRYLDLAGHGSSGISGYRPLGLKEQIQYDFLIKLFGLRMSKHGMRKKYGEIYRRFLWKERLVFKLLGALTETEQDYHVSPKGMYFWILMMREFFMGVNNFREQMRAASPSEYT